MSTVGQGAQGGGARVIQYGRGITRALGMPRQVRTLGDVEMWFRERAGMQSSNNSNARGVK